jgi:hypothetical protein
MCERFLSSCSERKAGPESLMKETTNTFKILVGNPQRQLMEDLSLNFTLILHCILDKQAVKRRAKTSVRIMFHVCFYKHGNMFQDSLIQGSV